MAYIDRTIASNAVSLLLAQGANFILPLITFPYLLRVLGPEQFGVMSFALALIGYQILVTDYGFNWSVAREIAERRTSVELVSETFWSVMAAKTILTVSGGLLLATACAFVPYLRHMAPVVACTWVLVLASLLSPQWFFQAIEKMWIVPFFLTAGRLLSVVATFTLVHSRADTWLAALLNALGAVFGAAMSFGWLFCKKLVCWRRPEWPRVAAKLVGGWHLFLSSAVMNLFAATNAVLLGLICGPVVLGYFAAADKLRNAAWMGMSQLGTAFYPRVNALMSKDRNAAYGLVRKLFLLQGGLALLVSTTLFFLAEIVVDVVMGPQYVPASGALRWLAFAPVFTTISLTFGVQALVTMGFKREFSRLVTAGAVINVLLFSVMSYLWRLHGAAAAVLAVEMLLAGLMLSASRRHGIPVARIMRVW